MTAGVLVLVGPVLLVPAFWALATSLFQGRGPANYGVLFHGQTLHAWLNSLRWVLLVFAVCAAGLGLAWLVRGVGRPTRTLVMVAFGLPVVTSPLTAAVAFRLLFDPHNGTLGAVIGVNLVTPERAWLMLGLAFAWQWVGLAFLVFHFGLDRMPRDLERVARALGYGRWRRLGKVLVPAVLPFATLAFLAVLIAATRVFELVLVAAPGPAQSATDVVGVHWWRSRDTLGEGAAAALAVALFAAAGVVTLLVLGWLRRDWPLSPAGGPDSGRPDPPRPRGWRRWPRRASAVAVSIGWLLPLAVLLLTSLRRPEAAATSGWWTGGYGPQSYGEAFTGGHFTNALATTAIRAASAAVLVAVLAPPVAYALTYRRFSPRVQRTLFAITAVLAVTPPQVIALPLGRELDYLELLGVPNALGVVHAAIGLPLAVLLIRSAFVSMPIETVNAALARGRSTLQVLLTLLRHSLPAVVAVAMIQAILVWNDLVVSLLLSWPADDQIMLLMLEQTRQFTTSSGALAARAVVVTMVPVAVIVATGLLLARRLRGVRR